MDWRYLEVLLPRPDGRWWCRVIGWDEIPWGDKVVTVPLLTTSEFGRRFTFSLSQTGKD